MLPFYFKSFILLLHYGWGCYSAFLPSEGSLFFFIKGNCGYFLKPKKYKIKQKINKLKLRPFLSF